MAERSAIAQTPALEQVLPYLMDRRQPGNDFVGPMWSELRVES